MTSLRPTRIALSGLIAALAVVFGTGPTGAQPWVRGDLVITGSATPNPAAGGGQASYAVNVTNESIFTATGVLVTIQLPPGGQSPQLVKCSPGVKGQACTESGGIITTKYATIKAHATVKVGLTLLLPLVAAATPITLVATAHADGAIGGWEPRDGSGAIAGVTLSESIPVVLLPSLRTATLSCGDDVNAGFFQPGEHTVQFAASIGCARSPFALKVSASGTTLDLKKFKIVGAPMNQTAGTVGIVVAAGATDVAIIGGGTKSKSGIEYFDYCLHDGGGNRGLALSTLRCFRSRSAGIDIVSDEVELRNVLVDIVVGGTTATTSQGAAGGVGMHLRGAVHVQDGVVRRTARIGIWGEGLASPAGSAGGILVDGGGSRVEQSSGIGIQLDGAAHQIIDTRVEGDGSDGLSTTGVLINGAGIVLDGLEVLDFAGHGIVVGGDNASIKRSTVEAVGQDSFVIYGAGAVLSGNSAVKGQKGFVVLGAGATLDSNLSENTLGTAFAVSAYGAALTGNTAKGGKAEGFALSGPSGYYNTNKAEGNVGSGFAISGSTGRFDNNTAKGSKAGGGFAMTATATNTTFKTNRAENNKGFEWEISPGSVDRGGNSKNGATFQFTTAGGLFE